MVLSIYLVLYHKINKLIKAVILFLHLAKVLPNCILLKFINKLVPFVTISPNPLYNPYFKSGARRAH